MTDPSIFYPVMALIILIILTLLTDISTALVFTTFIMTVRYKVQPCDKQSSNEKINPVCNNKKPNTDCINEQPSDEKTESVLSPEILKKNESTLDSILHPDLYTADDRIFDASIKSGFKEKKAKEIRSHWNNKNWKKYFDYEFGIHESENREWWTDNDYELNKKHIVI